MKIIGTTLGGTMIVELTVSEAKRLKELLAMFARLPKFPGQETPATDSIRKRRTAVARARR